MNTTISFKILILLLSAVFISNTGQAQLESRAYFEQVRPRFEGKLAYETVALLEQYWRIAGNTGFDTAVYFIAAELEKAGYELENNANSSSPLTYKIEKRPMNRPTWEPVQAALWLEGEPSPLLESESNRNMTYMYSSSTPAEGVEAEVVYIQNQSDLKDLNLVGKILFSDSLGYRSLQKGLESGAIGILTYDMPAYLKPEINQNSIQFRGLRYDPGRPIWALALSWQAKEKIKKALTKGPLRVKVNVQTKIYDSEELTILAQVKGGKHPKESLVFSAHIQEPGANDNASGVGVQLEMAKLTAELLHSGELELDRTLTFLWGDEIVSTRRYVEERGNREADMLWGISLDMVGENTELTGGSFLIEKMPDPSAIWTRGKDQHSEWGGRPLSVEEMKPHYLNDFILHVFQEQGKFANWEVNTNPFEGGSDHTPFLAANIPGLLLWHFTDQFYHTDQDRLDKVSVETMKNVGTAALVAAYILLNGDQETACSLGELISESAMQRLETEFLLSQSVIQEGGETDQEVLILKTWLDWYLSSLESVKHLGDCESIEDQKSKLIYFATELVSNLEKI
ncbi:M28 family peptidase [Algoriphagus namhaensis]